MKERIKELRKHLGLTQQEFADRLGLKRNTIAQYEMGRNEPIEAIIKSICKEYNVDETWLRTGQGDMYTDKTRNQELKAFFDDVLNDVPSSFRVRFATVLARLSSDQWKLIADMANKLVEECKEENDHDENDNDER